MSWRRISEARGIGRPASGLDPERLLATGTLLVEARLAPFPEAPVVLLDYRHCDRWDRGLSLVLHPCGRLELSETQGPAVVTATLMCPPAECARVLRVFYSWDAPRRQASLALELPGEGHWDRVSVATPHPIPVGDLDRIAEDLETTGPTLLVAWADSTEPIGPMPGLGQGTPIHTAAGWKPVEQILPGDLVQTSEHGFQPVRQMLRRETPAAGYFTPLILTAPSFGLRGDVVVSPEQRMLIEGADADYLFGVAAVLVEARHLASLAGIRLDRHLRTVTYHQLVFDLHSCMSIAGAWGESQFLPDISRQPCRLHGTILEGTPRGALPAHTEAANPMLQAYEAVVLVSAIRA